MQYDQLLALKEKLEIAIKKISSNYRISPEKREEQINIINSRQKEVEERLEACEVTYYQKRFSGTNDDIKANKKQVKYEFLSYLLKGYSFSDALSLIKASFPNPGFNIDRYISSLRAKGYFGYKHIFEEESDIYLTEKTLRYLENNASLKR